MTYSAAEPPPARQCASSHIKPVQVPQFLTREYFEFLAQGRDLRIVVRKEDVTSDRPFEQTPIFATRLSSGFELPPSLPQHPPQGQEQIQRYKADWAHITTTIYRFGGRILYREISPEAYEIKLELPPLHPIADQA